MSINGIHNARPDNPAAERWLAQDLYRTHASMLAILAVGIVVLGVLLGAIVVGLMAGQR